MKKHIKYFTIFIGLLFSFSINVFAASASINISASKSSANVGDIVTFTYTLHTNGDSIGIINNIDIGHSSNLAYVSGTESVGLNYEVTGNSKSYSVKYKVIGTGNATVNVKRSSIILLNSEQTVSPTGSKTISVGESSGNGKSEQKKDVVKSDNNNLKSLSINDGTIEPAFNKDVTNYTVTLKSNIEKITIVAVKEDSSASVVGDGEKEVSEGDNNFDIIVTSQKGTQKVYHLCVKVIDDNPIKVAIDGKSMTVVKRSSALQEIEGFTKSTIKINNMDIPCLTNEKIKITVVGLKDQDGNIVYYIYNKKDNTYKLFNQIKSNYITIINIDSKKHLLGYSITKVKINNQEITAYKSKRTSDFVIVYGINLETGKKGFYVYDVVDKTLQRYDESLFNEYNKKINELKRICIGLLIGISILFIILIMFIMIRIKKNKKRKVKKNQEKKDEKN